MEGKYDSSLIGPAQASAFRSSDEIKEDVEELLDANDMINPMYIDIIIENGVVTLKGCVNSRAAYEEAEGAAREVIGVTGVRNQLEISG